LAHNDLEHRNQTPHNHPRRGDAHVVAESAHPQGVCRHRWGGLGGGPVGSSRSWKQKKTPRTHPRRGDAHVAVESAYPPGMRRHRRGGLGGGPVGSPKVCLALSQGAYNQK
jgi:hypothetical protein